jgi:hypothetical protein
VTDKTRKPRRRGLRCRRECSFGGPRTIPTSPLSPTCIGSDSVLRPPTLAAFGGMDESADLHMPFAKCGLGKLAVRGMEFVAIFVDPGCVHTDHVCRFVISATQPPWGERARRDARRQVSRNHTR